jgi:hypothetical protein
MINSTTSTDRAAHAEALAAPGPATPKPILPRPDQLSTDSANFLREALGRQPEIRPEVLARAQALAVDPKYPTPETLKQVGAIILNSPDLSEDHS